jgi:hypothetical protein
MNFLLSEMTFLRYFMPLIIEGNRMGKKSKLYIGKNHKYNNPHAFVEMLKKMSKEYHFEIKDMSEANKCEGIVILVEGVDRNKVDRSKTKILSLTYMTDYSSLYNSYIEDVDHVIFPSKYFADLYQKKSAKNLYLGSPKYDVFFDQDEIKEKYGLSNKKKALIIYPRTRDKNKVDLNGIYSSLRNLGYEVLVKTRGKDPIGDKSHKGDAYFSDKSWYPHTTMELIEVSDVVINFNSTSIKESVLQKTPIINFNIKPWLPLGELYDYEYCKMFTDKFNKEQFENAVKKLTGEDISYLFNDAIEKYLFQGGSSRRILDFIEVAYG